VKNRDNDGVICDYCSLEVRNDFTYYSFDFQEIQVIQWRKQPGDHVFSADLCEECLKAYQERITKAYVAPSPNRFSCDISGEVISQPDFKYYSCNVSKVAVSISPLRCQCGQDRDPKDGPCPKCKSSQLQRGVDVKVDDAYLTINFSERTFNLFRQHIENNAKLGEAEWNK
jgi:hypothetical protein